MSHTLSYKDGSLGAHSTLTAYENGSLGFQSQAYHDGSLGFTQPIQYKSGSLGNAYYGGPNDAALNNGSFGSLLEAYKSGSLGAMDLGTSNVLFAVAGAVSGYFLMKKKKHKVAGAAVGAALGAYFSSKKANEVAENVKVVAVPEAGITTTMIEESNATGGCGCGA